MPCDSVITVSLELKGADLDLLKKALEATGERVYGATKDQISWYGGEYDRRTGVIKVKNEASGKLIKKAYSAEIVKAQAKRFGWQLKETSAFTYEITKR